MDILDRTFKSSVHYRSHISTASTSPLQQRKFGGTEVRAVIRSANVFRYVQASRFTSLNLAELKLERGPTMLPCADHIRPSANPGLLTPALQLQTDKRAYVASAR